MPETHIPYIREESDRAAIILYASLIENFVLEALKELMPSLNSDEKAASLVLRGHVEASRIEYAWPRHLA